MLAIIVASLFTGISKAAILYVKFDHSGLFLHFTVYFAAIFLFYLAYKKESLRQLLISGLILYGKGVTEHEFYLRRVTQLSVEILNLLGSVAFIKKADDEGFNINEYKLFLEYYIAE